MRLRVGTVALGLAMLLGGSVVRPPKVSAQDVSAEAGKRKVRTKVIPQYPPLAKQLNVNGRVKVEATIAANGRVIATKIIGGSPLLVNAALDALKKWRFEPAPKDTTEVFEFEFNGQN